MAEISYGSSAVFYVQSLISIDIFFFLALQGWYIVTYALGIYHLNLFIAFLSPKMDPALSDYEGMLLNKNNNKNAPPHTRMHAQNT